ncbi:MAG: hypothetical protein JWO82_2551 [Akkermansiaceae bacterium]|nr:hypothetical protein [Akkermansiaceae bacterium]
MNLKSLVRSPALILVLIPSVIGMLKYAMGIWAIRTAKTPAELKAQAEVARMAVSATPLRSLLSRVTGGPKNDGSS